MKKALVVGASGAVGKALIYQLLEDSNYSTVFVIGRKPLSMKHAKLTYWQINFETLNESAPYFEVDVVFSCLGTTLAKAGSRQAFYNVDHDLVYTLAKKAHLRGVCQFIHVSAMGAAANSSLFYNKVKGELEQHLDGIGFNSLVHIKPSLLLAKRAEFRLGEWLAQLIMGYTRFLFIGSLKKIRAIEVEQVAKAMRYYANLNKPGIWYQTNDTLFVD